MPKIRNLINQKFNKLLVIKMTDIKFKCRNKIWLCKCNCGNTTKVSSNNLISGHTKSCGCLDSPNIIGQKFGKLTVLSLIKKGKKGISKTWLCKCECGNVKNVLTDRLMSNHVKSCGCLIPGYIKSNKKRKYPDRLYDQRREIWRKEIYKKDNYTCQICYNKGHYLEAHHIINWSDDEKLRYDLNNGITLCVKCHRYFHKIYGKRNNTQDQLNKFKEKLNAYTVSQRKER